jgi:ribonuclease Z
MKFIADSMLGRLTKWLRTIGCDVAYYRRIDDGRLVKLALEQERMILTRDTLLIRRKKAKGNYLFVTGDDYKEQLRQVVNQFSIDPYNALLSRCIECNTILSNIERGKVKDLLPEYVNETQKSFKTCWLCNKVYWPATHKDLIMEQLRENIQVMKTFFHHRLVNDSFGDPCLYVRLHRERRSLIFDLGDISSLTTTEMNRITDVFVTHMHIDHFIGFDLLLRRTLRREQPLSIYGPQGIIGCIEGKLRGYSFNLIEEYPVVINAVSFDGKEIEHAVFSAKQKFVCSKSVRVVSDGTFVDNPIFKVRAVLLDHGIPCIAYSLEEDQHINIYKDRLARRGLAVGPWLTTYKRMLREKAPLDKTIVADNREYILRDLSDIARTTKGQKICFVTDIGISKENIASVTGLIRDADILFCEAYYLEADRPKALRRHHLTARTCGQLAKAAGVKRLEVMHFSRQYKECPELIIREAQEAFLHG